MSQAIAVPESPKAEELKQEVAPIVELASSIIIDSRPMYEEAADELKTIKTKRNLLEERRKAITGPLDVAKKAVMDLFRPPCAALDEAENIFKRKMLAFDADERRKAQAAENAAREAAQRERERLEAEARAAEASGDTAVAEAIKGAAEAITAAEPTVAAPTRPTGISTTVRWSAEVEDKLAFIKHCLTPEGEQYLDVVQIDMVPLNRMAVALKEKMKLPGIKAVWTEGMSVRS